jgi:uncharacterized membrane protein YjgN (DUF898 family)
MEYQIYYEGRLREGFSPDQVRHCLISTIGLAPEKVDKILASGPLLLVKSPDKDLVSGHIQALKQCGLMVSLRQSGSAEPPPPPSPPPPPPDSTVQDAPSAPLRPGLETPDQPQRYPFEFSGTGSEYFRIWITNLLLSLVTLGIYSPWAKVRRKSYFYGNTLLAHHSFEYTASPKAILKGRIVAVVCLLVHQFSPQISPYAYWVLTGIIVLITPWVIVRSLKFNAGNSMYRNIRFGFSGRYWKAAFTYILLPFLGFLPLAAVVGYLAYMQEDNPGFNPETLGIEPTLLVVLGGAAALFLLFWAIYTYYRQQRFIVDNFKFGSAPFEFNTGPTPYYLAALGAVLIAVLITALLGLITYIGMELFSGKGTDFSFDRDFTVLLAMQSPIIAMLLVYITGFAYFSAKSMHIRYSRSSVAGQKFNSRITGWSYIWLVVSNTILTAITLGLFTPWAQVRSHRYLMNRLALDSPAGLAEFTAGEEQKVSALGEEFADIWDFDIGF